MSSESDSGEEIEGEEEEDDNEPDTEIYKRYKRHVTNNFADNTAKNRLGTYRQFRDFIGRDLDDDVQYVEVEDWVTKLKADNYAPRSIQSKVYALSKVYKYLTPRKLVDENPVDTERLDVSKMTSTRVEEHTNTRHISKDEYRKMLDACPNLRDKVLIGLLWNCGLRASESISVKIGDIDRDEREIEVENAKQMRYSNKDTRWVWYSHSYERILRKWLDRGGRNAYHYASDSSEYDDDEYDDRYLLVTKQADNMAIGRVNEIVSEVAERAGIQEVMYEDAAGRPRKTISSHSLRYSYATHRIKDGDIDDSQSMPIPYLQQLMGHATLEQTRSYVTLDKDDIKKAEVKYRP